MPDLKLQDQEWSALMREALAGDAKAYRAVLSAISPYLRSMSRRACLRAGLSASDAEDVVQETLLAIHLKRHTWDPGQSLLPWMSVIARNKMIDALRRRGRRAEIDLTDFEEVLAAPPQADELERQDALRLLDCLGDKQRAAVEAVSIRGENPRAAAQRLGMTEGALRVAIHRGLKTMAALYQKSER